jgi:putative oxidoreductase
MFVLFTIARVLFSAIFIVSGTFKLMNITGTASMIAAKVAIPTALAGLAAQAESATGMQAPQLIAIAVGLIEVIFGLLLAFGVGTRLAALVLAIFTLIATFYFHDFWNEADPERMNNMIHAQKNLSIFAGLLVFFVLGSWRPDRAAAADEFYTRPVPSDEIRRDPLSRDPLSPA